VSAIRRSLKDGLLGDASNVRASRAKVGPFEPLRGHPEFRDMVVEAAPLSLPKSATPRQVNTPTEDTVTGHAKLKQDSQTPNAAPKPHIQHLKLEEPTTSASTEVLKWLFFFALFVVTAIVAFVFF
jgi:hypothetical protein